ncbi:MAG: hypothetical protein V4663_05135 [Bacteroidota bacterium]
MRRALNLILINLICTALTFAQSTKKTDSISSVRIAESFFNSSIKQRSLLFNGPLFQGYAPNVEGSANFQDLMTFSNGSIVYQGFRFDGIPLIYDIYQDKIISLIDGSLKYSFQNDWISEFNLNGHHFKHIQVTDTVNSVIKPGFYDLIYDGKSRIFVKRTKIMEFLLNGKYITYYFTPKTYYYIERGGKFKVIKGKKSFLNYFKDRKPELNKHLKQNKIKFNRKPEEAMILLVSFYERLPN